MIAKTTKKIRDRGMTKNYFRIHFAIMKPLTLGPDDARRAQYGATLQVPFAEPKAIPIIRAETRPSRRVWCSKNAFPSRNSRKSVQNQDKN